jgi:hypothetical protein
MYRRRENDVSRMLTRGHISAIEFFRRNVTRITA